MQETRSKSKPETASQPSMCASCAEFGVSIVRDITERRWTEKLLDAQKHSLELLVTGAPLQTVLTYLAGIVEEQAEGRALASILLLDDDGRLRNGASPGLPDDYISAIDGLQAKPDLGTCGAAAALGTIVITPNIDSEPNWQTIKYLPLELGLKAAWSRPILARDGQVLGTFGTYFRECREPDGREQQVVEILARTAAIAIEGKRSEKALHEAHDKLEQRVRERTAELEQSNQARQQLLGQLVTAQEDERRRISRELHDQMGQHLTAVMLLVHSLKASPELGTAMNSVLQQLEEVATQLSDEVDSLAYELRPTSLDDLGLEVALDRYVRKWAERSSITVDLQSTGLAEIRLPAAIETAIYRIVQEALTNVLKHARASSVAIVLERRSNHMSAIIEDNGCGLPMGIPAAKQRMGLLGMRERAALVGGSLQLESAAGTGTTVYLRVPLANEAGE